MLTRNSIKLGYSMSFGLLSMLKPSNWQQLMILWKTSLIWHSNGPNSFLNVSQINYIPYNKTNFNKTEEKMTWFETNYRFRWGECDRELVIAMAFKSSFAFWARCCRLFCNLFKLLSLIIFLLDTDYLGFETFNPFNPLFFFIASIVGWDFSWDFGWILLLLI